VRRVGRFYAELVVRAIAINQPHRIAMNHLDQVDYEVTKCAALTDRARAFISRVQESIGRQIDIVGTGEKSSIEIGR